MQIVRTRLSSQAVVDLAVRVGEKRVTYKSFSYYHPHHGLTIYNETFFILFFILLARKIVS